MMSVDEFRRLKPKAGEEVPTESERPLLSSGGSDARPARVCDLRPQDGVFLQARMEDHSECMLASQPRGSSAADLRVHDPEKVVPVFRKIML
ncbi:hypothetical protein [Bradyrhizobium septentrionale]|uniref:Uncharacterized protein n=1 Tax=Bradyrhizobium septentrionale TaxID=1404411 RepID=A0ABZ2NWN5_9BRAD